MSSDAGDPGDRRTPAAGEAGAEGGGPSDRLSTGGSEGTVDAADADPTPPTEGFGPRGWVLVGVVLLSTVLVPGAIYAFPALPADAGLPFLVAMLALPLLPAVLLGAAAVWSMSAAAGTAEDRD